MQGGESPLLQGDYTVTNNQRRLLWIARDHIASGRETYICLALTRANHRMFGNCPMLDEQDAGYLKYYIHNMLEGSGRLQDWQHKHGIWRGPHEQQLDRLAWIDWMLGDK